MLIKYLNAIDENKISNVFYYKRKIIIIEGSLLREIKEKSVRILCFFFNVTT